MDVSLIRQQMPKTNGVNLAWLPELRKTDPVSAPFGGIFQRNKRKKCLPPNLTRPSRFPQLPLMGAGDTGAGVLPWTTYLTRPSRWRSDCLS